MKIQFGDLLRECDIFGKPVHLNYKGDSKFKTPLGGFLGIGFVIGFLFYGFL